ncbi:TraR/DksA family transcriptional regulator [Chitiniphilus shinanonensis]|uniref:TraR/DksA family transcriptional regulator n=1 Tax=Chitiniphilus shinanonensis TaxID=553088 RepID=UPI00304D99BE
MDQYDRASELEQAERDAALAAARTRQHLLYRADCADCGEDLAPHRMPYGTCVACQATREHRAKLGLR